MNNKKKVLENGDELHYNEENIKKVKGRIKERRNFKHKGAF